MSKENQGIDIELDEAVIDDVENDGADEDYQNEHVDDGESEQDNPLDTDDTPPDDESETEDDEAPTDEDELGFSFDEPKSDEGEKQESAPINFLRKDNRELKKKLKEYEAKQAPQAPQALREKPTLADSDWNDETYQSDLEKWHGEKEQHDQHQQKVQAEQQQVYANYNTGKEKIKATRPDYDEKEKAVVDTLSIEQQNIILTEADDSAKMTYILGQSPDLMSEMAELTPAKFLKKLGVLEAQMKTATQRKKRNPNKPKPKPASPRGSAGGLDSTLARLEAEAEKTGNRSKVIAYKKSLKK